METTPDNSPAPTVTRNAFDKAAEQRAADEQLRHLTNEDFSRSGRVYEVAMAHVKAQHPRLHAIAEGRWEDDNAFAAAGQDDPLPHLRD